jgi:hypothetical protein
VITPFDPLNVVDLTQGHIQLPDALSRIGPQEFNQNSPISEKWSAMFLVNKFHKSFVAVFVIVTR